MNVHLNNNSSTAEPFVTKLGMVMHHHGPECCAKEYICHLQVQGHSEGSYDQIYDISVELLIILHPNLVGWHIIISWRVLCVCVCVKIRLLFSRSRSQRRIKTLLNLYVSYMFCTTVALM